jgi:outer membrane protein TolC
MIRNFARTSAFLFFLICPFEEVFAKKESRIKIHQLSQQDVLDSALKNYPTILSAYEKVSAQEGSLLAQQGFFDIKLKQNYNDKTRGYYDGKTYDAVLEKEMGFMGSKLYGGYRKSFGSFAGYDGNSITNGGGEYRFGGRISLLKNRDIDPNRLGVMLANLDVQQAKVQVEKIKMEIKRDATKAYWKWLVAGKVYKIYQELYDLSLTRQSQLQQRLKKGDVAQIIVDENRKNILRRKSSLAYARQNFENSAIYLSLFWRDEKGAPSLPKSDQLPDFKHSLCEIGAEKISRDLPQALITRPELRLLKLKKEQELGKLKYASNLMQPQLDVDFGVSKDLGNGPQSRSQGNNFANVDLSMPLQFREARGKKTEAESNLKALEYQQQIAGEMIEAEIKQIEVRVKNIIEMHDNLEEEAKLAHLLEESEREKFKHGASNFFLVNMREQDTAASKAAVFEMFEKYQDALADYDLAIFNL